MQSFIFFVRILDDSCEEAVFLGLNNEEVVTTAVGREMYSNHEERREHSEGNSKFSGQLSRINVSQKLTQSQN